MVDVTLCVILKDPCFYQSILNELLCEYDVVNVTSSVFLKPLDTKLDWIDFNRCKAPLLDCLLNSFFYDLLVSLFGCVSTESISPTRFGVLIKPIKSSGNDEFQRMSSQGTPRFVAHHLAASIT